MRQTKRLVVLLGVLAVIVALWASAVVFEGDAGQGTSATMTATGDRPDTGQGAYHAPRTGVARFTTTDIAAP
jgi:hypothetical protein